MTFKQLAIGDRFEFVRDTPLRFSGLVTGPWRKRSPRTYLPVDERWGQGVYTRIGSTACVVTKED